MSTMKSNTHIAPTICDIVVRAWYEMEVGMQIRQHLSHNNTCIYLTFLVCTCRQVQDECDDIDCKEKQSLMYHKIYWLTLNLDGQCVLFPKIFHPQKGPCHRSPVHFTACYGSWYIIGVLYGHGAPFYEQCLVFYGINVAFQQMSSKWIFCQHFDSLLTFMNKTVLVNDVSTDTFWTQFQ